jgi:hypothetical protein
MSLAAELQTPAEQARAWLAHQPPAVSGQDGHSTTLRVASLLRIGFHLGEGEVSSLMADFNRTCSPPWSERELAHKVASAFKAAPRRILGFMLAPERIKIARHKPAVASVRRIKLGAPPTSLTIAPIAPNTPADLCPTCWTRRISAPINGPTCSCKPYVWPIWTTEQIANLQPSVEDRLINAPTAPSALENHPPLVPLESPWIEGAHYRIAGATEWPNRLDLYVQDPSGPWIRRHGVLISVSEP